MHTQARARRLQWRQRGFTLVEIVVVLAIIGILVAAAIPLYLGARLKAYRAEAYSTLQEIKTSEWGYYQQNNTFAGLLSALAFVAPSSANWSYSDPSKTATDVTMLAIGQPGSPVNNQSVSVVLRTDGSASAGATF